MLKDGAGNDIVLGSKVVYSTNNRLRVGEVTRIRTDASASSTYVKTIITVQYSLGKVDRWDYASQQNKTFENYRDSNLFSPERVLVVK